MDSSRSIEPASKPVSIYRYQVARSSSGFKGGARSGIKGFPINRPPSWSRFLELRAAGVLDPGLFNPMRWTCNPCHNHWDAIIKMETFNRDSKIILRASGANVSLGHANRHGSGKQEVTRRQVWQLFGNLSRSLVVGVREDYGRDFRICGYGDTLKELDKVIKSLD